MHFVPYNINQEQHGKLLSVCPANSYYVADPREVPISLPQTLMNKALKCVILSSGDGLYVVTVVNILRVDLNDRAVDQQPFIATSSSGTLSAGIVQHGDWKGRSIYPGNQFFDAIRGSGIEQYYPYVGVPEKKSGSIFEIKPASHSEAFWNALKAMNQQQAS